MPAKYCNVGDPIYYKFNIYTKTMTITLNNQVTNKIMYRVKIMQYLYKQHCTTLHAALHYALHTALHTALCTTLSTMHYTTHCTILHTALHNALHYNYRHKIKQANQLIPNQ